MTSSATAKQCAACGAPALHDRAECWSCGEPLAVHAPPAVETASIPPPESYLRPCPRCGEVSAVYHRQCPSCGASLGAALPAREQGFPAGWDGEVLADGTVRLCASRFTRTLRTTLSTVPITVAVWLGLRVAEQPSWAARGPVGADGVVVLIINDLLLLLGTTLAVWVLIWAIFGGEEWQVGPDLVVIRRRLFRWRWKRAYTSGRLQVVHSYHYRGSSTSLVLFHDGRQVTLAWEGLGAARARDLGAFLSRVTGWPFQDGVRNWQ